MDSASSAMRRLGLLASHLAGYPPLPLAEGAVLTMEEVAKHVAMDDAWTVIRGTVYDVTEWLEDHPGGKRILLSACGQDSTEEYDDYHGAGTIEMNMPPVKIVGKLGEPAAAAYRPQSAIGAAPASELGEMPAWAESGGQDPEAYTSELRACREELTTLLDQMNCNPLLIRLAWHDSGTFDGSKLAWPTGGGANGSIRFPKELAHSANAGLDKAVRYLRPIHERHPTVSWADLIQLGSATAVQHAGGPAIPMRYGRADTRSDDECPLEGNLPDGHGWGAGANEGLAEAAQHLRDVFYRMGFGDQEIVALSGAHTLGRAFKERSGLVSEGYGKKNASPLTSGDTIARGDGKQGVGMPGGKSWTKKWLAFDNEYFTSLEGPAVSAPDELPAKPLLRLKTDNALTVDPQFRPYFELYRDQPEAWRQHYAAAHAQLSELGSRFLMHVRL